MIYVNASSFCWRHSGVKQSTVPVVRLVRNQVCLRISSGITAPCNFPTERDAGSSRQFNISAPATYLSLYVTREKGKMTEEELPSKVYENEKKKETKINIICYLYE